jgi:hypothetical protein
VTQVKKTSADSFCLPQLLIAFAGSLIAISWDLGLALGKALLDSGLLSSPPSDTEIQESDLQKKPLSQLQCTQVGFAELLLLSSVRCL